MAGWIGATDSRTTTTGVHTRILPLVGALAAALAWVLSGAAWSDDFYSNSTRKPFGVYAHVDFEDVLPELWLKSAVSSGDGSAAYFFTNLSRERTWRDHRESVAGDPKRHFATVNCSVREVHSP